MMGGACSAYVLEERRIQGFGGDMRERDHLGNPGLDGRITLKWIFKKWDVVGMDWIELAKDWDRWRAFLNAVMNLEVP